MSRLGRRFPIGQGHRGLQPWPALPPVGPALRDATLTVRCVATSRANYQARGVPCARSVLADPAVIDPYPSYGADSRWRGYTKLAAIGNRTALTNSLDVAIGGSVARGSLGGNYTLRILGGPRGLVRPPSGSYTEFVESPPPAVPNNGPEQGIQVVLGGARRKLRARIYGPAKVNLIPPVNTTVRTVTAAPARAPQGSARWIRSVLSKPAVIAPAPPAPVVTTITDWLTTRTLPALLRARSVRTSIKSPQAVRPLPELRVQTLAVILAAQIRIASQLRRGSRYDLGQPQVITPLPSLRAESLTQVGNLQDGQRLRRRGPRSVLRGPVFKPPVNTVAPVVSGTLGVGFTATTTTGTWTNPGVFTYQWQNSPNGSTGWADISGATSSTYVIQGSDITMYLRAVVTSSNPAAVVSANSNSIGPVIAQAPVCVGEPTITGPITIGGVLVVTNGNWLPVPTSYAYQWQRSLDLSSWSNIGAATSTSYTITIGDTGYYFRCRVTATNALGSGQANSNWLGPLISLSFICQFSTANPTAATQTWNDITPYVLSFNINRGKQRSLDRFEAGTMALRLRNTDRRFDPTYTGGPYYGNLYPLRMIRFGFVINGTITWAFTGYIDHWPQIWNGPRWAEVDLTCVDGFEFFSNVDIVTPYATYTTTMATNANLTFTSTSRGFPGTLISIQLEVLEGDTPPEVSVNGTAVKVRSGHATATAIMNALNADQSANQLMITTLASGSNGTGFPAGLNQTYLGDILYAQEKTGSRVTEVLDQISWPTALRLIPTGSKTLQGQIFTDTDHQKALDQLYDVTDTEQGAIFMDGQGRVVFLDQGTLGTGVYSVSQATFTDAANDTSTSFEYQELVANWDRDLIYNDVRVTRLNGTEQVASDATSKARYFTRTLSVSSLNTDDNESMGLAQAILSRYKAPTLRFEPIRLFPGNDVSFWQELVSLDLMYLATVKRTPPGGGSAISQNASIINISIQGTPGPMTNVKWNIQVDPSANSVVSGVHGFIFDDNTYGVIGVSALGY